MKSIVTMPEKSLDSEIIGETSLSADFSQSFLGTFIGLFLCFFRHGVSIDPVSQGVRRILGHLPGFLKGEHVSIFPCDFLICSATKVTSCWQRCVYHEEKGG